MLQVLAGIHTPGYFYNYDEGFKNNEHYSNQKSTLDSKCNHVQYEK